MAGDILVNLRKELHKNAELSGRERNTSSLIYDFLRPYNPARIITDIGGHGLAAIFNGKQDGPTVMIRADLDALPIPESSDFEYASQTEGVAHKCGHDGHMTILSGLAPILADNPPDRGRVILLYQPAEEIGKGALRVLEDNKFKSIQPDYVFALHNLPGFKTGQIICRHDVFASASSGLIIKLLGETSHAAEPQRGKSPALALAQMINALSSVPQFHTALHEAAKVTVIHARLGEIAFGTSPGYAEIMATLRAHDDNVMKFISDKCESLAKAMASGWQLNCDISWDEEFPATVNDNEMVDLIINLSTKLGLERYYQPVPFSWSEDFGNFISRFKGALFGLGAGEDHPALHHPKYDFPDEIIDPGINLFRALIYRLLSAD